MCCRVPVSSCKLFSFIFRGIDEEIGGRGWKSSGNQTAIAWATLISKKPGFEKLPCFQINSSRLFIYLLCLVFPVVLIFFSWRSSVIKYRIFRAISTLKSGKSTRIILKRNFILQKVLRQGDWISLTCTLFQYFSVYYCEKILNGPLHLFKELEPR